MQYSCNKVNLVLFIVALISIKGVFYNSSIESAV